jgi:uncharacterized protein (TIGR03083 family)
VDELTVITEERDRLVSVLRQLTDDDWRSPSLCRGWAVEDVVAHLVAMGDIESPPMMLGMHATAHALTAIMKRQERDLRQLSPRSLMEKLDRQIERRETEAGLRGSWLTEVVVHGLDVTVPLGHAVIHDEASLVAAAEFYAHRRGPFRRGRRRAGLLLIADDVDWSTGAGPEVTGPMWALVLTLAGRTAALARLDGPGAQELVEGRIQLPRH